MRRLDKTITINSDSATFLSSKRCSQIKKPDVIKMAKTEQVSHITEREYLETIFDEGRPIYISNLVICFHHRIPKVPAFIDASQAAIVLKY